MITVETIIRAVARHFVVPERDIKSRRRQAHLVRARRVAMWLARDLTTQSYPALGRKFYRDHTTVLEGVRSLDALIGFDPDLSIQVAALRLTLTAGAAA